MKKVILDVNPGACGFLCRIEAIKSSKREAHIKILDTKCEHVQILGEKLKTLNIKDIFSPYSTNRVYRIALGSGCHTSCIIPVAIIKAVEIVLELAVAKDSYIKILSQEPLYD